MSNWPVFITAPEVPVKQLNKALLLLADYEFDCSPQWTLILTKTLPPPPLSSPISETTSTTATTNTESTANAATTPSIPPLPLPSPTLTCTTNDFAQKSPHDIYTYLADPQTRIQFRDRDLTASNWLVIDQRGLDSESCLLAEYISPADWEEEKEKEKEAEEEQENDEEEDKKEKGNAIAYPYRMCRIPWTRAWAMFCNLDIANMDFEEWVDEERGPVEADSGAWAWGGPFGGQDKGYDEEDDDEDEEVVRKREMAVRRGVEGGWV
ncbi:hypothetical protein BDV26DRAFT_297041 [Aspergillus bertholletiae]|uniref:Uncharacterized protein n=1 Tax=Aspergillus bertholletiae TaxID=1226010 RepID=A0A5N7AVH0_9EURO|nr:hypothetical protein BDV26DRAFT_297041 [Aspergillus bertholletiae]